VSVFLLCSLPTPGYSSPAMAIPSPNLTQRPPRSPRVRLGGYAILPRMLDKCRATLAGTNGEYIYACPTDQLFLSFVGLEAEALKNAVAAGKGDGDLLTWIQANARQPRMPSEIAAWSAFVEQRSPGDVGSRDFFHGVHQKIAPKRTDLATWFDLLDLDDYVSFGGTP
jgi:hypothetical protein